MSDIPIDPREQEYIRRENWSYIKTLLVRSLFLSLIILLVGGVLVTRYENTLIRFLLIYLPYLLTALFAGIASFSSVSYGSFFTELKRFCFLILSIVVLIAACVFLTMRFTWLNIPVLIAWYFYSARYISKSYYRYFRQQHATSSDHKSAKTPPTSSPSSKNNIDLESEKVITQYKTRFPFQAVQGKVDPYTGAIVETEEDYERYLLQFAKDFLSHQHAKQQEDYKAYLDSVARSSPPDQ